MPSEEELIETLELLSEYVEEIGDSVEGDLDEIVGIGISGPDARGILCFHGASQYFIVGTTEDRYFSIIFPSYIIESIALNLSEDTVDDLLGEYNEEELTEQFEDLELTQKINEDDISNDFEDEGLSGKPYLAAKEWLDSLDEELCREIRFHLRDRLSDASVAYTVFPEKEETIYGFQVERKVFPYEDEFTLGEFNHSVQAVVSIGVNGHNFLGKTFDISEELSAPTLPWRL